MEVFGKALGDRQNQLEVLREATRQSAPHSCWNRDGERTEAGMRANIRVAVQYIEAWISGNGCVPIYGLMEDAATAEIPYVYLAVDPPREEPGDGRLVTKALFRQ